MDVYSACNLCPRECHINRNAGLTGYCGVSSGLKVTRAALHQWEEPCLVGEKGSGAVFFAGCGLGCIFCQNHEIAKGKQGIEISLERLADIFLELQEEGAANINLVTGTQYVPSILQALKVAKEKGLSLPILWNSGGYEKLDTLEMLRGSVDIFLPDAKYALSETASAFSNAPDYPEVSFSAIGKMLEISGKPVFNADGKLLRGTVVRLLLLPDHLLEAKTVLTRLYKAYGNSLIYSLMRQYTPMPGMKAPLDRRVSDREYSSFVQCAVSLGVEYGYTQDAESVGDSFIPPFDCTGVLSKEKK